MYSYPAQVEELSESTVKRSNGPHDAKYRTMVEEQIIAIIHCVLVTECSLLETPTPALEKARKTCNLVGNIGERLGERRSFLFPESSTVAT